MAAPVETSNKISEESGAESPTTARPLEMDDDDVQETGVLSEGNSTTNSTTAQTSNPTGRTPSPVTGSNAPASTTSAQDDTAPAQPPRPLTEAQKNEAILKEAFPSVDLGVIKAVLSASAGRVEPAFNALLEMTDPDAAKDEPQEAPPPQPPRPQGRKALTQLEADELYARQLAEHYDNVGAYEQRTSNPRARGQNQQQDYDEDGNQHSFFDDDLPVIRENLRQGFFETQTKVNGWIDMFKKRIEDSFDESEDPNNPQHGQGYNQGYGRPGEPSRRSGDYDADPQVLGDDFAGMRLSADGTPAGRNVPYTGIQRQHSTSPRPKDGRRVGFKEETEEINMYETSPQVPPKDAAPKPGSKTSKWQPLSAVEPSPIGDNDPFSLGDSEDERDNAKETKETSKDNNAATKTKDSEQDDNERLKQAAAEAMADSLVDSGSKDSGDASTKKT